jgi:hypothetical protein
MSPRQVGCLGPRRRYLEDSWRERDMATSGWCRARWKREQEHATTRHFEERSVKILCVHGVAMSGEKHCLLDACLMSSPGTGAFAP